MIQPRRNTPTTASSPCTLSSAGSQGLGSGPNGVGCSSVRCTTSHTAPESQSSAQPAKTAARSGEDIRTRTHSPAGELTAPCLVSDLPTVTFAVGEHLERAEAPRGIDTRRVRDEISPADHFVDEHVARELTAVHGFPDPQAPVRGLGSGEPRHLI